jgi:anaerobic selenocysteine-containing dehydrogenase
VHASRGRLPPAAPALRSESAIVAGLAAAALGVRGGVPWLALVEDYDRIRARIERVIPGFDDYSRRAREPGGFVLPSGARVRRFATPSGRALFRVHALPADALAPGRFLLTTIRSHDQFNTTVYGFDDRLRGLRGDRRVVLLHAEDIEAAGLRAGQGVDLTSHFRGETRTLRGFRVLAYDLPRRCAAAYFPEANGLVPLASRAERSHTPTYKSIEISIAPGDNLE